jgi:hypothetical protein
MRFIAIAIKTLSKPAEVPAEDWFEFRN